MINLKKNLKIIVLIRCGFKTKLDSMKNIVENFENKSNLNLLEFRCYKTKVLKTIFPNIDDYEINKDDDIFFLLEKEEKYTDTSKKIVFNQINKFFDIVNTLFDMYGSFIDIKEEIRSLELSITNTDEKKFNMVFNNYNYLIEKKHMFLDKKFPDNVLGMYVREFLRCAGNEGFFKNLKDNFEFLFNDKHMMELAQYNKVRNLFTCLHCESEDYKQCVLEDIFYYKNEIKFIEDHHQYFVKILSKDIKDKEKKI